MKIFRAILISIACAWLQCVSSMRNVGEDSELYKSCPAGQIAVQNAKRTPESNACSKPAGISIGGEEDYTYCCDRHDVCYETCNIDKDYCEAEFSKCLQMLCRTLFSANKGCSQAASMYVMGTQMFGGNGFAVSQQEYCECIDAGTEKVRAHYGKMVHSFYASHAPDKADEWKDYEAEGSKVSKYVAGYQGKAGGKREQLVKLGKLHYQLYAKYDTAIKHVGPRRGMTPPRPKAKKDEL